jgi:hypothetical protein
MFFGIARFIFCLTNCIPVGLPPMHALNEEPNKFLIARKLPFTNLFGITVTNLAVNPAD